MPNITLSVSQELKNKMDEFSEVSWSDVCRRAIAIYLEARSSANPIARAKYLELQEKEVSLGYSFGLKLAEIVTEELDYNEIHELLENITFIEHWGEGQDPTTIWVRNDGLSDPDYDDGIKGFNEALKEKGSFAWLLNLASLQEGFHRNFKFVGGMNRGLREIFR